MIVENGSSISVQSMLLSAGKMGSAAPGPVERLTVQAGGPDSLAGWGWGRRAARDGAGVGHERAVRASVALQGLLEQPVEQHPA